METDPPAAKIIKLSECVLEGRLELGHRDVKRERVTLDGCTHDWAVFVRGAEGNDIQHIVKKVVFHLHESYSNPERVVRKPPYSVSGSGYAGFVMPIDVYFQTPDEPKKVTFTYDLYFRPVDPPVTFKRIEKVTFSDPSDDFQNKLRKGGVEGVEVELELGHREVQLEKVKGCYTHDWAVFVRGANGCNIQYFVEKVVFHLHKSFRNYIREVKEPPYSVSDSAYASFDILIDVYFKKTDKPQKATFKYDLFLVKEWDPESNFQTEKVTFPNPSGAFRYSLIAAGWKPSEANRIPLPILVRHGQLTHEKVLSGVSLVNGVGHLTKIGHSTEIEMKIPNCPFSQPADYLSKFHMFLGCSFQFRMLLDHEWASVYASTADTKLGFFKFKFSLKSQNEIGYPEQGVFVDNDKWCGIKNFIKKWELGSSEREFSPSVICTIKCWGEPAQRFRRADSIRCSSEKMLEERKRTDVILKVQDKEFPAHRVILESCSPVFSAMFSHEMEESRTGVVNVKDVDPYAFQNVLRHIYCKDFDGRYTLDSTFNMCAAAVKYDLPDLKKFCEKHMITRINTEVICDIIKFADFYNLEEIAPLARQYFKDRVKKVLETYQWKKFAKENQAFALSLITSL